MKRWAGQGLETYQPRGRKWKLGTAVLELSYEYKVFLWKRIAQSMTTERGEG